LNEDENRNFTDEELQGEFEAYKLSLDIFKAKLKELDEKEAEEEK